MAATALVETDLGGRHALVTGAGRGIGRACALALAAAGARLSLVARTASDLEAVAAEAVATGVDALPLVADVNDPEAVARAVAAAEAAAPIDICVNSAGLNRPGPTVELDLADWDLVLNVNLRGTFLVTRAVAERMLDRGQPGRIINVSSQLGVVGYPGRAAYCASKHAVNGLTKALAVEWARDAITVNAIGPTFINTPMTAPMFEDPEFKADVLRRIPMGRIGEVEEVTGAILFLASDSAGLITGQTIEIDGGWTAW